MNKMLEVIRKRRSIRSYQSKEVEEEKVREILKAAMFAPSANHRRPWEFVVVREKESREKLAQATPWASFVAQAPVVLVVCAQESLSREWLEDAAIVGGYIYLEAVNQGLGTCWVQIRGSTTPKGESAEDYVRQLLGIPADYRVVALFPLGYPQQTPPPHLESEFEEEKIHFNKW